MKKPTAIRRTDSRAHRYSRPGRLQILVGCALLFAAVALSAAVRRVRVDDRREAAALIQQGHRLVVDYGAFQLLESANDSSTNGNSRLSVSETIDLAVGRLETHQLQPRHSATPPAHFEGIRLNLVQFIGPIRPEWRAALVQTGVRIVNYVPENSYVVRSDARTMTALQTWAGTNPIVQCVTPFAPRFKINPQTRRATRRAGETGTSETQVTVQLADDGAGNAATIGLLRSWPETRVRGEYSLRQFRNLIVSVNAGRLAELAEQGDVVSIHPAEIPEKHDERQAQILAGQLNGSRPDGPGYLEWLAAKGFRQDQFDASGFCVDLTDSGIDNGSTAPGHFGLYTVGDRQNASRVVYQRIVGTANPGSTLAGCDGHGTLNAHILAGFDNDTGQFPHSDAAGFLYGLGICPFVRVGASVVFDPVQFTHPDYARLQSEAYASGARISVNSWGTTENYYTPEAQAYDALVRDAQPAQTALSAPGNQEMVIIFAAGNRGPSPNTVGSPATAKNVITVGASENFRSLNPTSGGKSALGFDACGSSDANANSADDLATFSSRGPCTDGRQKPDLVAPGTHVTGGVPQGGLTNGYLGGALECFSAASLCAMPGSGLPGSTNNFFPLGQQLYTVSSGTSQAAPAVGGACALLRQFFLNRNWPAPSPAMTKAYLMNSARYLGGADANDDLWSAGQGMGAADLGRAFDDQARLLRDQLPADLFTESGQQRVFTGRIAVSNEPVRITLAWTDAPGNTVGAAYNNDLDLVVEFGGTTYRGNHFSGAFSAAGGEPDPRNNVETVLLPAGQSGEVTVIVTAANINSDGVPNFGSDLDQDFALVCYNVTNSLRPRIAFAGVRLLAESFFPTNGAVDSGETVSMEVSWQNHGTRAASNLMVSLTPTDGVVPLSGPQACGNLMPNTSPVSTIFTFKAPKRDCGATVKTRLAWAEDGETAGVVELDFGLGLTSTSSNELVNPAGILIPEYGSASNYPATIQVSGLQGVVERVTVTLRSFSHSWPDDVDILLVGPEGQGVLLISDCGGGVVRDRLALKFDDDAIASLSDSGAIGSGDYKPTNFDSSSDVFAAPAPTGPYSTTLAAFKHTDPNGLWRLFVRDDGSIDGGTIGGGWALSITTSNLSCETGLSQPANPAISLSLSENPVFTSSNLVCQVLATNHGPSDAVFVTISNLLPPGFALRNSAVTDGRLQATPDGSIWSLDRLAVGHSAVLTMAGSVTQAGLHQFTTSASSATPDSEPENNSASVALNAFRAPNGLLIAATNTPPELTPQPDRTVHAGSSVQIQLSATDRETPVDELNWQLSSPALAGAMVAAESGLFTWQTTDLHANSSNQFIVRVEDGGNPPLTAEQTFTLNVVSRPTLSDIHVTSNVVSVTWTAVTGQAYQLQTCTNLRGAEWVALIPAVVADRNLVTHTNPVSSAGQFYRVLVLP